MRAGNKRRQRSWRWGSERWLETPLGASPLPRQEQTIREKQLWGSEGQPEPPALGHHGSQETSGLVPLTVLGTTDPSLPPPSPGTAEQPWGQQSWSGMEG